MTPFHPPPGAILGLNTLRNSNGYKNLYDAYKFRPAHGGNILFGKQLKHMLLKNDVQNKTFVLAADFNLSFLDYEENKEVRDFVNVMFNFGTISTTNKLKQSFADVLQEAVLKNFANLTRKT